MNMMNINTQDVQDHVSQKKTIGIKKKPAEHGNTDFKQLHTAPGQSHTGVRYTQSTYRDPADIDLVSSLLLLTSAFWDVCSMKEAMFY